MPAPGGPSRKAIGMSEKIAEGDSDRSASLGFGMTEKEIDDRVRFVAIILSTRIEASRADFADGAQISKAVEAAVEAEVTRRLAERERQRAEEEVREKTERATADHVVRSRSKSPTKENSLPSGVLTPLLKRHKDLDDELKNRLHELEKK